MVKSRIFLLLFNLVALKRTVGASSQDSPRGHYESARLSKEYLRDVAQRDFGTMVKLKNLTDSNHLLSQSLLNIAKRYVNDFSYGTSFNKDTDISMADYVEGAVRNPLAILRMIHRVAYFLYFTHKESDSIPGLPVYSLDRELDKSKFPLKQELEDAAVGILKIHFMYNLNATDLAAGKLRGFETGTKLLASQCLYLGVVAKILEEFTLAVDWLREAKRLALIDGTTAISTVQTELVEVILEHDEQWKDMESFATPHYFFTKALKSLHVAYEGNNGRSRAVLEHKYAGQGRACPYWPMNTWALCSAREEHFHKAEASAYLFCWREFKIHKTFVIGPLRMEFLSRNPDIVKIHEAFTTRTLTNDEINAKAEAMTGLKTMRLTASDPVQLVSHSPGGHSKNVHVDSVDEHDFPSKGGRIATFLVHMTTVQDGGRTVFPAALTSTSSPTKGSAIFWFNTFSDGSPDLSTSHADCPVVLGEHLVAYKWIRYFDQFSTRKCLPQPKERFQVLVNGKMLPVPSAFQHKIINGHNCEDAKPFFASAETTKEKLTKRKYAHTPTTSLKALMQLEWEIYHNVKQLYLTRQKTTSRASHANNNDILQQENKLILRYLQDFNDDAYVSLTDSYQIHPGAVAKLAGNPLAVYRTFWRFENYVKKLLMIPEIQKLTANMYNQRDGPGWADLRDAMTGILLIQKVHNMESYDIAEGFLAGRHARIVLTARQCIELGHQAIANTFYYIAITWMEVALDRVTTQADGTAGLKEVQDELETAKKVHDKLMTKSNSLKTNFYVDPYARFNDSSTSMQTRVQGLYNSFRNQHEESFAKNDWIELCRWITYQTLQEESRQFCWQETAVHPYFKIAPLKAELLSMSPRPEVVLYRDILGPSLLAFLRNDTNRSYTDSIAPTGETGKATRLSATTSIPLRSSQETARLLKLTKAITGLKIKKEWEIKIHSYAPGGQFPAHADSRGADGTRIATVLYYVTQAELGGGTAFPQASAHARLKPGSAVFWFNTLSSGEMDRQTYHGGCPVIFGEKRVAGQYIYYYDQDRLQCRTDPMDRIEILVNGKSKYHLARSESL